MSFNATLSHSPYFDRMPLQFIVVCMREGGDVSLNETLSHSPYFDRVPLQFIVVCMREGVCAC